MKTYDLKGSKINRYTVPGEAQTFKDVNLLNTKSNRLKRNIKGLLQFNNCNERNDIKKVRSQIKRDSKFLRDMGFCDYSVLMAIEKITPPKKNQF